MSWSPCFLSLSLRFHHIVLQSLSPVRLSETPWTAARQTSLFFTISQSVLRFVSAESVMPSNRLIAVTSFSSCPQPFPATGAFPVSQLFTSNGQSIPTTHSPLKIKLRATRNQ